MNDKFLELPEEKRQRIINAGFEIFSRRDYKHASTEDIAARAGISKGLLFYYFHDKKTFYAFLFEQAAAKLREQVSDDRIGGIRDFFELCAYAAERKCRLLRQNPYLMEFILRAYYSRSEAVSGEIDRKVMEETAGVFRTYFSGVDFSKFRDDVDPKDIYRMLAWMTDGYLHERQRAGLDVELSDMMERFKHWSALFRRMSYKEEYLR